MEDSGRLLNLSDDELRDISYGLRLARKHMLIAVDEAAKYAPDLAKSYAEKAARMSRLNQRIGAYLLRKQGIR